MEKEGKAAVYEPVRKRVCERATQSSRATNEGRDIVGHLSSWWVNMSQKYDQALDVVRVGRLGRLVRGQ